MKGLCYSVLHLMKNSICSVIAAEERQPATKPSTSTQTAQNTLDRLQRLCQQDADW